MPGVLIQWQEPVLSTMFTWISLTADLVFSHGGRILGFTGNEVVPGRPGHSGSR